MTNEKRTQVEETIIDEEVEYEDELHNEYMHYLRSLGYEYYDDPRDEPFWMR